MEKIFFWFALAFVLISPITAMYPCSGRGYYLGYGAILMLLVLKAEKEYYKYREKRLLFKAKAKKEEE